MSLLGYGAVLWLVLSTPSLARQFELDFDGPEASWQVRCRQREATLLTQERTRDSARRGCCEFFRIKTTSQTALLRIEHEVSPIRVLDELTVTLWVRSDRPGPTLAVRLAVHGSEDPETGAPLTMFITGDKYDQPGKWQQLKCRTEDKAVKDQLRQLRARKKVPLDSAALYLDRVVVGCQLSNGTTEIMVDDLDLGPVVPVDFETVTTPDVRQIGSTEDTTAEPNPIAVDFNLHKLRVDGKPFFPRMVPYRQEHADAISGAGFNTIWVPDASTINNTGQFRSRGIWLTSTPPFAKGATGEPLDSDDASLMPFTPASSSILFWTLGIRMNSDARPRLPSWSNQVRDADRSFKRPIAADIADDERVASRHLDFVGLSRHVLNSGVSLADYRDELIRRRDRAWPGSFCFTWIQTEPAAELLDLAPSADETPMLEPEQVRMQVYAALAAGCRGIGFWTTTPLDSDAPGARERYLMMTQLNLELGILEPWIATGSGAQLISFTVENAASDRKTPPREASKKRERELSAALIRSEYGALLLPMWLEEHSQFVPAQLGGQSATIIVPGGGETATVWQITTTGRVQNLSRETVAGGLKIVVPKFDQTAAILMTSDTAIVEQINQHIGRIQERSATVMVELCRLKLERVRRIDEQLQQLGVPQSDSRQLLSQAKMQADMAEAKLKQQEYHAARQYACVAMQLARLLQRAHWDRAVAKLPTPVTSPYALCFQTLPAHWRLVKSLEESGKSGSSTNLLPSGEFEDLDTLIAAGWRHEQRPTPDVQSTAELFPTAKVGKSSLRLAAEPTAQNPASFQFHTAPVSVTSPPISAHSGHVIKITGWVKTPHPIPRSLDGVTLYDNLLGKTGALRITDTGDWQRFELWRIAPESQSVTVTAEMHGLGEVLLDDLRITSTPLPNKLAEATRHVDPAVKPSKFTLDPFDLRRFTPRRDRKSQ
jgi:hypothetical protein